MVVPAGACAWQSRGFAALADACLPCLADAPRQLVIAPAAAPGA
ncbi:hypothetical protein [Sorangium sp. So ce117]